MQYPRANELTIHDIAPGNLIGNLNVIRFLRAETIEGSIQTRVHLLDEQRFRLK
jgi:hypothetical protein